MTENRNRGTCRVGTSGWSYQNWKGPFYPKGLKQGDWLPFYGTHFSAVEVNATFYRLPTEKTVTAWAERTPDGFLFAVKGWRAITHFRRLAGCTDLVERFFVGIEPLGGKCGPILFQLPPRFALDVDRLTAFLDGLPRGYRYAVEFRDESWHCDDVYRILAGRNVAFCPFELVEQRSPRIITADFAYVRLHGREGRYVGDYDEEALADWASWLDARLDEGGEAFLFFDNTDGAGHAVKNAQRMTEILGSGNQSGAVQRLQVEMPEGLRQVGNQGDDGASQVADAEADGRHHHVA